MPRRKTENEADSRERILAAATEVFATIGYSAARVDDIAARARVNKALLYYHVGDKQQLYVTLLTETIERARQTLQAAIAEQETPAGKMQAILHAMARFGSENRLFIPMVMREIASGGANLPDEMIVRMSAVFRTVAAVLAEGMESGDFREVDPLLTHVSIIGSTMFLVASAPVRARVARIAGLPFEDHGAARLAEHVGNLFIHGLEVRPTPKKAARTTRRRRS